MDDQQTNEVLDSQDVNEELNNSPVDDSDVVDNQGEQAEAEEPKDKVYTQKQVDRQMEKRVRKERRKIDELQRQIEELRNQFAGNQQQSFEPQPVDESNMSPQEYARKVLEERDKLALQREQQEMLAKSQQAVVNDLMQKGREKYQDFEETVNEAEYTEAMVDAALATDNAEDVLMYFAENYDETVKLAKKSPLEQKRAVNRIANRFQQKKAKVSNAPEPMEAKKSDTRSLGNTWLDALQNPNISLKELAKMRKG